MKQTITLLLALLLFMPAFAQSVPAFPGAEGYARYTTTGGRGGNVWHVTNLSDNASTKGSLRWALKQSRPSTIVFDVSGYIDLTSDLSIPSDVTIAGQTAPGDGITLRYYTVTFTGCDNVIVRYIRFRRSQLKDINDGADATWGRQHKNIILDHCSFSWSIDEVASFYDNLNFTMQWCTLGEGLANPGHSKGEHSYGGIWGGKGASFHHNFICHVQNRAPRFNGARYGWEGGNNSQYANPVQAERVDFRNCVMYNWGKGNGCYGGPGGGQINMVNNYYKAGPGTGSKTRVTQISVASSGNADKNHPEYYGYASRYYIKGNYVTAASKPENYDWSGVKVDDGLSTINGQYYIPDPKKFFDPSIERVKNSSGVECVSLKMDKPVSFVETTTHSAQIAYEKVLLYCGASLSRDEVDARYMEEARTGTVNYTGETSGHMGIVDMISPDGTTVSTRPNFPALKNETRPSDFDTDQDGMPDEWERLNGLNPSDASDAKLKTLCEEGYYTNLEVYLNGLVEHITRAQNADAQQEVEEYYPQQHFTGIAQHSALGSNIARIEYFSLDGTRLAEPQQGLSVRRITYSDGRTESVKVLKR